MRQRRWLELIKDYSCTINYHSSKANVVANVLSRKSIEPIFTTLTTQHQILTNLERVGIEFVTSDQQVFVTSLMVQPTLIDKIIAFQKEDLGIVRLIGVEKGDKPEFNVFYGGIQRFGGRLCMPDNDEINSIILQEAHFSLYMVDLGRPICIKN